MKTHKVNVPFEIIEGDNDYFYAKDAEWSDYCTVAKAKNAVRRYVVATVKAWEEAKRNTQRHIICCKDGTLILVSFRHGGWCYEFAGPDRKGSAFSSACLADRDYQETVNAARKHAEYFGGINWEQ